MRIENCNGGHVFFCDIGDHKCVAYGVYDNAQEYSLDHAPTQMMFDCIAGQLDEMKNVKKAKKDFTKIVDEAIAEREAKSGIPERLWTDTDYATFASTVLQAIKKNNI